MYKPNGTGWIRKNFDSVIKLNLKNIFNLIKFYQTYFRYKRLTKNEDIEMSSIYPCLGDDTMNTHFDAHYFYQAVWAIDKINKTERKTHVDIGSDIKFVGMLSAVKDVTFVDIRPPKTDLKHLKVKKGSITDLPFKNDSLGSLSCLHVAEHVGLGRYGDMLDPGGTKKACRELQRILAINGDLMFSTTVGKEKTYFNAHRVFDPQTIVNLFSPFQLEEFSLIDDSGSEVIKNASIEEASKCKYGCGLFIFINNA